MKETVESDIVINNEIVHSCKYSQSSEKTLESTIFKIYYPKKPFSEIDFLFSKKKSSTSR